MNKLFLISLLSISFLACTQDTQGILPGGCVVDIIDDLHAVLSEDVYQRASHIGGKIEKLVKYSDLSVIEGDFECMRQCITLSQNMSPSQHLNALVDIIQHIDKKGNELNVDDYIKFFCLPKLFDEKMNTPFMKKAFENTHTKIISMFEIKHQKGNRFAKQMQFIFNKILIFMQQKPLQELILEATDEQAQHERIYKCLLLEVYIENVFSFLKEYPNIKQAYFNELMQQIKKIATSLHIVLN